MDPWTVSPSSKEAEQWQKIHRLYFARKQWLSCGDSYEIGISDDTDDALALAIVLAIVCVQAEQADAVFTGE